MLEELTNQVEKLKDSQNLDPTEIKQILKNIHSREDDYRELFWKLHDILKKHNIQCCHCRYYVQHEQRGASYCGKYLQSSISNEFPECFESWKE